MQVPEYWLRLQMFVSIETVSTVTNFKHFMIQPIPVRVKRDPIARNYKQQP